MILQHLAALPLDQFLQCRLIVPVFAPLGLGVQNIALDDLPGRADAPVQIDRRQDGFHRVGLDGRAAASAAGALPPAQLQIFAQVPGPGHLHQALLAHQGRPGPGQVPLRQVGVGPVEIVRRDHPQHRVPQKLQTLVALAALAAVFVGVGAVGQGVVQQRRVPKGIAQGLFQGLHVDSSSFLCL